MSDQEKRVRQVLRKSIPCGKHLKQYARERRNSSTLAEVRLAIEKRRREFHEEDGPA